MDKSIASRCRELLQFLSSTKGDLANVTGPPSMLAPMSVVEVGTCWAERPAVFAAPASEPDPDRRMLLVLRMFLIALRAQVYVGGSPTTSIKKPLNAFLGELFLAEWTEQTAEASASASASASATTTTTTTTTTGVPSETKPRRGTTASTASRDTTATAATGSTGSRTSSRRSSREGLSRSTTATSATSATSASSTASEDTARTVSTRLVAEQVSHHPPITAMHIAAPEHGVRADGYARVEMTFSGSVQVRQVGHAIMRVEAYEEDYLMPLPDIKVRGFLSGRLYPEITDTYHIVSSNGHTAEIAFSGQGFAWGGKRNAFVAKVYGPPAEERGETTSKTRAGTTTTKTATKTTTTRGDLLYTVEGVWSQAWTVRDHRAAGGRGAVVETYDVDAAANAPVPMALPPHHEQDPWESRRAWAPVLDGLRAGNLGATVAAKTHIEQAQRRMRAREAADGDAWTPLLFASAGAASAAAADAFHALVARLPHGVAAAADAASATPKHRLHDDRTKGVWRVDDAKIKNIQRPFRGTLTPLG